MKKRFTRFGLIALALILVINSCAGAFAATTTDEISQRENESSEFAYYAATQGMVLLENDGTLPIAKEGKVALFGAGARHTVKGGTGSGDVNQRAIVTVEQGFINAGYTVTSGAYLDAYQEKYNAEYTGGGMSAPPPIDDLADIDAYIEAAKDADWAFYVISRNSGEFADRTNTKLDYELSDNERANIEKISAAFDKTIIVLNVGGVMDTKFFKQVEGLDAMVLMSQAGMRGGDAVVAVLNGTVNPSGKLTDTWPVNYSDYACAADFGANDDDVNHEYYKDDIYVGYRYFDTFGVDVAYPFGYGGSYTTFDVKADQVAIEGGEVAVTATVKNTGAVAGREVVEIYFSAPDGALEKPYQELAAYGKTKVLEPGKSQSLKITFPITEMSSYSMEKAAYILEKGDYIIRVGNCSRNTSVAAVLTLAEDKITEQLSNQMVQDEEMDVLSKAGATAITYDGEAAQIAGAKRIAIDPGKIVTENNASEYDAEEIKSYVYPGSDYVKAEGQRYTRGPSGNPTVQAVKVFDAAEGKEEIVELERPEGLEAGKYTLRDVATGKITMTQFVADLSPEEMSYIVEGIGYGGASSPIVGAQGNAVNGSAGETTARYYETRLIPNTVLADGPAGIRITQHYTANGTDYYQFATAFPIGTLIAMTWDPEVIQEFGNRIGTEMTEFGVTLWLAPGMNIHRNALCGRNFEYYSEDPLIAGLTAGYTTLGVQSHPGIGVTLKHYSGNNQENNRNAVNNTITERAIREIYLKGFEIAVKMAQPMAIMTSYNQNNSMPAADDYDMCTDIPRGEWGYRGLIMTDWGGGQSTPVNSMHAGNDLIMPGGSSGDILAQLSTVKPTFDAATGYVVKVTQSWGQWSWTTESWGEFSLAADGADTESVTVAADVDVAGNADIQGKVQAGTATVTENADGTKTVTYKGNYGANSLPLGDLQKSAANVLNIIMNSTQFEKITREYEGDVVTVEPYSAKYADELETFMTVSEAAKPPKPTGKYVLVSEPELGGTYVIVAGDAYALNGEMGATPVTVDGGAITSDVSDDMLWTFEEAEGADAATDGNDTYLISNADGQNLRRGSGSNTPPLSLGEYNVTDQRFYTWSAAARDAEDDAYTLYLNGSTGRYYAMVGAETGFNTLYASAWDPQTTGSSIRFYAPAAGGGLSGIDFTDPADVEKYDVINKDTAECVEGVGVTLTPTADAFEPIGGGFGGGDPTPSEPKDLILVPVNGDWTGVLQVEYDPNDVTFAMSSYFSFLAMAGDDYQNMAGIRGTNNVFQDYLRQDGVIAPATVETPGWGATPTNGFIDAGTYWLKLEKEGDAYFASWSADGETFTELFKLEDTGVEADYIVIDAYKTSTFSFGGDNNWLFTLKNLELEGGEPTVQLDKKAIRAAIRAAKAVPRRYYLEDSLAAMDEALAAAEDALANATTQEALDAAAEALNAAIEALERNPNLPKYNVTFDFNYPGAPEPVVVQVEEGKTAEPIDAPERAGYAFSYWGTETSSWFGTQITRYDFNTLITGDLTLKASWTKDWNQMYSLAEEYADYFPFGNFGTMSPGGDQVTREYNTYSGNSGKMTYNFGATESRNAYEAAVAEINADETLTEAEKAEKIKEADGKVLLGGNNPLASSLNSIRSWNEAHPEGPKKWYRQHVLFWHGSEQNAAFYHEGFDTSKPLASREVMNERIDSYVEAMFKRYQEWDDVILSWDVVNEALDDYNGMVRNGWNGSSWGETQLDDASNQSSAWGTIYRMKDAEGNPVTELSEERLQYESEWIRVAFASARKWQQELGVHWTLYYNDYMNSSMLYEPKVSNTLKMLKPISEAGNLDGYGMQARLATAYPTIDLLRWQIEEGLKLADEVSFSEGDVRTDFEVNPLYDPEKPTRRVQEGDEEWDAGGSGSWSNRSRQNGNTYDVSNGPVRRKNDFNANDPETMRIQADYYADLMDIMLEKADLGKVGAVAIDGTSDSSTFNSGTGCQIWDSSGNEKPAFYALIGCPNRHKMGKAIEAGPALSEEAKYTAETWAPYAAALEAAEALVDVRIYDAEGVEAVKKATADLLAATEALEEKPDVPPVPVEGDWVLAETIEPGVPYVIVADGAYAMTNRQEGPALRTYAGGASTTLASAPVTVEGGKITSEVTDDMQWTFSEFTDFNAVDGEPLYYVQDLAGGYLRRGSGSSGQGAQLLVEPDKYSTIRYNAWSFKAYEGEDAAYAMYANSERDYGTDYPFYVYGNGTSFDSPGHAQRDSSDPFAFMSESECSHIQLYTKAASAGLPDIDFTNPADASKFIVDNQTDSSIVEGEGFYMISTNEAIEDCKGQLSGDAANTPRDTIQVPVAGDWTATLYLKVDTSGSNGQYEFLCLYGMADYDNGVGIRAGNGSTVNFKEVDGVNESSIDGMKVQTGLTSGTDHWYRLEKEGTTYTGYLSEDGETFQKVFTYEDTGIEAKMIVIDAYSGRSVGYQYWLQSLTFEGGSTPVEPEKADKTALDAAIAAAEAVDKSKYTDETVAALDAAIAAAKAVQADDKATQAAVDAAAKAVDDAVKALEEKPEPVDKGELDKAINAAGMYDENDYTPESYAPLAEALEAAKAVQAKEDAAQDEVDAAAKAVNDAIAGLEKKPEALDKDALIAAIASAEALDPAEYTEESAKALADGIAAAKDALANAADQAAVDAAVAALDEVVKGLEKKPVTDKSELDKAISAGELYDENDYTPESYAPLAEALEAAKAVQAKEDATQDEVDAAAKAINDAIAGLEKKPDALDKDALISAISEAEALDPAEYTEESAKALADGIAAAKDALASAADQAAVDAAVEALKDVVDKLEKKPDVEPFRFDDVKDEGKFYFTPVYWAYEAEPQITNGKTATLFGPDDGCTRGQVVTFLWRAAGCPEPKSAETPFTDLKDGGFYVKAVAWAVENEITNGMTATTFAPDATCTRGQIVTFLWRFKGQVEPKSTQTAFTDVPATAFYAKAVAWAVENEVTNGMTPTTFVPGNTCTRGQVVTFLYRATAE